MSGLTIIEHHAVQLRTFSNQLGNESWPPALHPITSSQIPKSPATPEGVATFAAELLGTEPPPLVPWEVAEAGMTPMVWSFYSATKRVRNEWIKGELGVVLNYRTYREGLGESVHR
jgi:hypothetical protein